jgi:hypothetical protein
MKIFRNLLLILATLFVFELTFTNEAKAACTTDDSGAIEKDQLLTDMCETTPDLYEIVIYKLYLCTSAPTGPTTTTAADLDSGGCEEVFDNSSGSTASVEQGTSVDLGGTFTRPPNGTYTHGYAKLDNTFGITASVRFDGGMTGQTGGAGMFCATVAGSGTSGENEVTNSSICSTEEIEAGKFTESLTTFGEDFEATGSAENINNTTADITGYLIDTNGYLAEDYSDVDRLDGLVTFADAVEMTDSVSGVTMSFNVGSGMGVMYDSGGDISLGSGPFQAIITAN